MSSDSIHIFRNECRLWLEELMEMSHMTVTLKTLLAEALGGQVPRSFVDGAEFFQQAFIRKDEVLALVRHEVNEQKQALSQPLPDQALPAPLLRKQKNLRRDMRRLMKDLVLLKADFEQYLRPPGSKAPVAGLS